MRPKIALLYTGGTIGMSQDPSSNKLIPLNFAHMEEQIPELAKLQVDIDVVEMWQAIDSSDIQPHHWKSLAEKIYDLYHMYDGFVILHGTDTMGYTASALSFMLQNLGKAVVLTGSQLPIGVLRTDGKENLLTAIEIAAAQKDGKSRVPEVCIYFEYKLLRGNRSKKISTEHFDAFASPNYPFLAEAGVNITYRDQYILKERFGTLQLLLETSNRVASLKLFPGFNPSIIDVLSKSGLYDALILQGFGAGNTGSEQTLIKSLAQWTASGKLLAIGTQCVFGSIYLDKYASSGGLNDIGAIDTKDQTLEASLTKMMLSLGCSNNLAEAKNKFTGNWAGELKD